MSLIAAFGKNFYIRGLFFSLLLFSIFGPRFVRAQSPQNQSGRNQSPQSHSARNQSPQSHSARAQPGSGLVPERASIVFWNTENLFDTIPSPFHDDRQFTPDGEGKWTAERYATKIRNLARVIDELSADVVGLAEVENEEVVRDLVKALETDYNYIHRTSGDSRGIDVALLYKGDKFFPGLASCSDPGFASGTGPDDSAGVRLIGSGTGREFLHITGELLGERVEFIVCHLASNLNGYAYRRRNMQALRTALEGLLARDPAANIVVMGDMNAVPGEKVVRKTLGSVSSPWDFMYAPHWDHYMSRQGSYNYRGRWYLYDWMMLSPALIRGVGDGKGGPGGHIGNGGYGGQSVNGGRLRFAEAGIYAREYLVETVQGVKRPRRTFYGGEYSGGYSDHFPVWVVLAK